MITTGKEITPGGWRGLFLDQRHHDDEYETVDQTDRTLNKVPKIFIAILRSSRILEIANASPNQVEGVGLRLARSKLLKL